MPRSSRHKTRRSHHRRGGGSPERSESDAEVSEARVSRDHELERRKSLSHSKEATVGSGNGFVEHGKKRKERVEETTVGSDRWVSSGGGEEQQLDKKRTKSEVFGPVDVVDKKRKDKGSGEEVKSRKKGVCDERNEESGGAKVESGKRRDKDNDRRGESGGKHRDERDREKERDKERERAKEKDREERERESEREKEERERERECEKEKEREAREREREKEREVREKEEEREREKEKEREKEREREREGEREKERERERERDREKERERDREREREKERERERERQRERDRDKKRERERERDKKEQERERERERDIKDQDIKHERYEDTTSRKNGSRASRNEEEHVHKKDIETNDCQVKDKLRTTVSELEKHDKKKGGDSEGRFGDGGESNDKKNTSRDDHSKVRSSKDQRFDNEKYKEKYRNDGDRDKRHGDDRRHDEYSSRHYASERADCRGTKEGNTSSESHYRKDKIQDTDRYGKLHDEYGSKHKENRGRKRNSDENDDYKEVKPQNAHEGCEDLEKVASSGRLDSQIERARDHRNSENIDSSPIKVHPKGSSSSSPNRDKEQSRQRSKPTDPTKRESPFEDRMRQRTSSVRERTPASRLHDRDTDSWSAEKSKPKDELQSREVPGEVTAASQYDRTPRKDTHASPNQLSERSPSSNDQRFSGRTSGNRNLDTRIGQRSSSAKYRDREGDLPLEKPVKEDRSQSRIYNREPTPSASTPKSRAGHFSGSSPNRLPPPPPRTRSDDSSFMGSYNDDNRLQNGERRFYSQHKRSDQNLRQGHGNAWSNAANWPSPVANGFIPMQHGAPHGFHPPVHQFPAPPLFDMRPPPIKLTQPGVSYPMHEAGDRFASHVRPFGWHNPLDPPHLQVWGGGNGVFGGEPYIYGRQEWDLPSTGSRGWETSSDALKGQTEMPNLERPGAQKEPDHSTTTAVDELSGGLLSHQPRVEQNGLECSSPEKIKAKGDTLLAKHAVKTSSKVPHALPPETSKLANNGRAIFHKNYLSRVSVSHDLVESGLYQKCMTILGNLDLTEAPQMGRNGNSQDNQKSTKFNRKETSENLLSSLFLTKRDAIFQRAMNLHKHQTQKLQVPLCVSVLTEGKNDSGEVNCQEKVADIESTPAQESLVSLQLSPRPVSDTIEEEAPLSPVVAPDKSLEEAPPSNADISKNMEDEAPPSIADEAINMEEEEQVPIKEGTDNMEVPVPTAITGSCDAMEEEAPASFVDACDREEEVPASITDPCDGIQDGVPSVAGSISEEQGNVSANIADHEDGNEEMNIIADGDISVSAEVKNLNFVAVAAVVGSGAEECEDFVMESMVDLSRIPNSPENTH